MKKNQLISVYQILGSSYGVWGLLNLLFSEPITIKNLMLILPFLLLFFSGILASILLLLNHKKGVLLSIIIQIFQIVQWSLLGFKFAFVAGSILWIGFNDSLSKISVNFSLIYTEFSWEIYSTEFFIHLNIVPIVIIFLLKTK